MGCPIPEANIHSDNRNHCGQSDENLLREGKGIRRSDECGMEMGLDAIVVIKYWPNIGTSNDVGGIKSMRTRKNTVKVTKMEMEKVILWSDR